MNYSQLSSRDEDAFSARIDGENDAFFLETPNSKDYYYLAGWHDSKAKIAESSQKSIDFATLQQAVTYLHWDLDFYEFCQQILQKDDWTNEQLENNAHCLKEWDKWHLLNKVLHLFDRETLERIVTVYQNKQSNK